MAFLSESFTALDALAAVLLLPLTLWILLSGLDDLVVDAAGVYAAIRSRMRGQPARRELLRLPQVRIAIFVPCWHEDSVIASMIERNRERIHYGEYAFFVGAYPNDDATVRAVRALERKYANVHLALCPHDGPTSKADCLNQIFQRMLLFEEQTSLRFDVMVTHDAEDVIHPDSLHWINWYSRDCDMVQVPVLPLVTPMRLWTHGVYCDEFAEYQMRDMPARQAMGAFVPSNGVGTGFRRDALEGLAGAEGNRIFEPVCLTEDYENGFRLKLRGARQMFVPMQHVGVATREYFPQTFATAVRQRTRWVTGIALQTWDRHGWRGSLADRYWLWRDRKGLIGNPASLLTNVLFAYGLLTWVASACTGMQWGLARSTHSFALPLVCTTVLGVYRIVYRCVSTGLNFGWPFAGGVPVRVVLANAINSAATVRALQRFAVAKWKGEPLRWVKTEHQYPSLAALRSERARLGEVLVRNGYITDTQLERALASQPSGQRIGEYLVDLGYLDHASLYEALSLQTGLPMVDLNPGQVRPAVARSLPARILRHYAVVPFRVEAGQLCVAGPEPPPEDFETIVREVSCLTPKFYLTTPANYRRLVEALL